MPSFQVLSFRGAARAALFSAMSCWSSPRRFSLALALAALLAGGLTPSQSAAQNPKVTEREACRKQHANTIVSTNPPASAVLTYPETESFVVNFVDSHGNLPVYTSSTPKVCTVNGSTVNLVGTGSCSITGDVPETVCLVDANATVNYTITATGVPVYTVTTTADDAGNASNCPNQTAGINLNTTCSLRDAILAAEDECVSNYVQCGNSVPIVNFWSGLPGANGQPMSPTNPAIITLTNGVIAFGSFEKQMPYAQIVGPGLNVLKVSGGGVSKVFQFSGFSNMTLSGLTITGANGPGILINTESSATLTSCAIDANNHPYAGAGDPGAGGGIAVGGTGSTLTLIDSTVSDNTAAEGGGIWVGDNAEATLIYSTVDGNSVSSGGQGAGIWSNPMSGMVVLENSTVAHNYINGTTGSGAGFYYNYYNGTPTITNSLIAGNWLGTSTTKNAWDDIEDGAGSTYGSWSNVPSDAGNGGGDTIGTYDAPSATATAADKKLCNRDFYGGLTQVVVPTVDSPAICAAVLSLLPTGTTFDQRGPAYPNQNTTYPGFSGENPCVDSGSVQTRHELIFGDTTGVGDTNGTELVGVPFFDPTPALMAKESGKPVHNCPNYPQVEILDPDGNVIGGPAATEQSIDSSNPGVAPIGAKWNLELNHPTVNVTGVFVPGTSGTDSQVHANRAPTPLVHSTPGATITGVSSPFTVEAPSLVYDTVPAALTVSQNIGKITVYVADSLNELATTATNAITITATGPAGYTQQVFNANASGGIATLDLTAFAPTIPGTYTLTASTSGGANTPAASVTVYPALLASTAISSESLVTFQTGVNFAPVTVSGGSSPYTFGVTSTLPAGLSMNSATGAITGTPSMVTANASYMVTVTDANDAVATASFSLAVGPGSWVVNNTGDDSGTAANCTPNPTTGGVGSCMLRDALVAAKNAGGANITFDGTAFASSKTIAQNTVTLNSTGSMAIPANTTITGPTTAPVTINGAGAYSIFTVGSGVTGAAIANLTLTNGGSAQGGAIQNAGTLTLTGSTLSGNSATASGGAISNTGTLTAANCTFYQNTAATSGGAIQNSSTAIVTNSTFSGNSATTSGGAIGNTATLTIVNDIFTGDSAPANMGSEVYNSGGTVTNDFDIFNGVNGVGFAGFFPAGVSFQGLAPSLSMLGWYGGSTQTFVPLPGSIAIYAGRYQAGEPTTDQRGVSRPSTASAQMDIGAVQTDYVLTFATQPSAVQAGVAMAPAPAVTLTENGMPAVHASGTISMSDADSLLGSGKWGTLTSGTATFANVILTAANASDTLTASLPLTWSGASTTLDATVASNSFAIDADTTTVLASPAAATYNSAAQSITLSASVSSIIGPASAGTVTFTVLNGTTPAGAPATSGAVSNGSAQASYSLPAALPVGQYTIRAVYNAGGNFATSSDSTHLLTITKATPAIKTPPTASAISYGQTLASSTLSGGTASTSGAFAWSEPTTAPAVGTRSEGIIFVPKDTTDYNGATGTVTVTVNKATQKITITTPTSAATYGAAPIEFKATGGPSGEPIVFSVLSGPGKFSGSFLSITGTGTVVVAANQAGNSNYEAAPQATHNILVNKAKLVATANNLTMKYGAKVPALTYTITGFVNGDTAAKTVTGVPELSTTATSTSAPGKYVITIDLSRVKAANYTLTSENGTLTVTPLGTVDTPAIVPSKLTSENTKTVTITDNTPGAAIRYTLGTAKPTTSSALYTKAFTVSKTTTVNAIAFKPGYAESVEKTLTITIP